MTTLTSVRRGGVGLFMRAVAWSGPAGAAAAVGGGAVVAVGEGTETAGTITWRGVAVGAASTGAGDGVGAVPGRTGRPIAAPASRMALMSTRLPLARTK